MRLEDFKEKVRDAFGDDLHRASPATVREFLDRLQEAVHLAHREPLQRFELDESARSYEEVMRSFFAHVLDQPSDDALMMLWTVALDLSYAIIESRDAVLIGHLFRDMEDPTP